MPFAPTLLSRWRAAWRDARSAPTFAPGTSSFDGSAAAACDACRRMRGMTRSHSRGIALGAWLAPAAIAFASLTDASVATADVSVSVNVAPEITVADPEEIVATTEPPEPIYEERLDVPGPGYFWVGGSWGWTGADWAWAPGRWLLAPEGRVYIEPYYERVGPNVVYVRGYWGAPGAPHRYYGGERIRFAEVPRPADYRRGEPPRFERRPGAPPGARPAGFYERGNGPARPLPHATWPAYHETPHEAPRPTSNEKIGAPHEAPMGAPHEAPGNRYAPPSHEPQVAHYAEAPHAAPHSAPAPRAAPAGRPGPSSKRR